MATLSQQSPTDKMATNLATLSRKPLRVWGFLVLIVPLAFLALSGLEMDHRFEIWFGPEDPITRGYARFHEEFGSDESLIVLYQNQDLFSPEELDLNRSLSAALGQIPHVVTVLSITTLQVPQVGIFGAGTVPLIPESPGDMEALQASLQSKQTLLDNLISANGTATGIVLTLESQTPEVRRLVIDSVRTLTSDPAYSPNRYHLVGVVPILAEMHRISGRETGKFVAVSSGLMFLLVWGYFGSLLAAVAAVAVSLLTILLTLALFVGTGQSVNLVAGVMPLVLLVVSLSVSIHILHRMMGSSENADREAGDPAEAVMNAIRPILKPCLFSSLTTACAFGSFTLSSMPPLRAFGLFCGLGVLLSFVLAFSLVPGIVTAWGRVAPRWKGIGRWDMGRALAGMVPGILMNRRPIWVVTAGILVVSVLGISRLTFETDQMEYLEPSNPVRMDNEQALEWFQGTYTLEILLDLPDSVQHRPAEYLELLGSLEEGIGEMPEVVVVQSAATAIRDFVPEGYFRPLALAAMARSDVSGTSATELRYLASRGSTARISVRTRKLGSGEIQGILKRLDEEISGPLEEANIGYAVTGVVPMFLSINRHLLQSQVRSFLLSLGSILLLLALLFRNARIALLGMIPNVMPAFTTLGVMGLVGVPMDVATVLIAAIALGIAVDDTIHFLWAFREGRRGAENLTEALERAVGRVGRPLVLTSLILMAGFLTMTLSSYLPVLFLGLFVSLNVFLAICYDLILLPTLLSADRP